MPPFFSIVIVTLNSESTIRECLESIKNQSFQDYEVIVQDGISSDKTLEIIESCKLNGVSVKSERDTGVYHAMNKALNRIHGKWVYFLGSDDMFYSSSTLAEVAAYLKNNQDLQILYGNVFIKNDTGWASANTIYDGFFSIPKLLLKNICHQAIFYKNSLFEDQGLAFNPDIKICADYEFNLTCFAKCKSAYVDLIIAVFNGGGISSKHIDDGFSELKPYLLFDKYFKHLFSNEIAGSIMYSTASVKKKALKNSNYTVVLKVWLFQAFFLLKRLLRK